MKRDYLIPLVLVVLVFSGCAQSMSTPTPNHEPAPTSTPPAPTPTLATMPEEILASHFGIVGVRQDIEEITTLVIRWDRPHPGPFIWGRIEPVKGQYHWDKVDEYVQRVQARGIANLATIWPFAEWDQINWGSVSDTPVIFEAMGLGRSRRKPYDMDAYKRCVSALVERYDGDGIDDMPGLEYPIKYWEASNEPSMQSGFCTFFNGSSEDYLEVLKATYQAVKEADAEAKVLHAGMAGVEPSTIPFWEPIFEQGSSYFDIANIHSIGAGEEKASRLEGYAAIVADYLMRNVVEFKKLLSECGIDKPIWVTETQIPYYVGETVSGGDVLLDKHAVVFAKIYVIAFACGADKVFYTSFRPPPSAPPQLKQAALIDENGERMPAYYALKTLISKLDKFTSAEKLAEGQYRFTVEGKTIYVLWGSGKIPTEMTGEVLVTNIYGEETRMNSSAISLTESPIFVEAR